MKFVVIIILSVLFLSPLTAQDSITVNAEKIFINNNGNIYTVKGSRIAEIDRNGIELMSFTLNPPEVIDYCDASNPLEIVLYNSSSNRVCILDSKLSPISDAVLNISGADVSIVCSSSMGGLWYLDINSRKISHLEKVGKVIIDSQPLYGIPSYKNDLPELMIETRNYLLLSFPESGLMLFDRGAKYIKTIQYEGSKVSGLSWDYAVFRNGRNIILYDFEKVEKTDFEIGKDFFQSYISGDELIIFDGKNIFFKKLIRK